MRTQTVSTLTTVSVWLSENPGVENMTSPGGDVCSAHTAQWNMHSVTQGGMWSVAQSPTRVPMPLQGQGLRASFTPVIVRAEGGGVTTSLQKEAQPGLWAKSRQTQWPPSLKFRCEWEAFLSVGRS